MAIAPLNSFADVQAFFDKFVTDNNVAILDAPHLEFWKGIYDYNSFVNGDVPGVSPGMKILIKGDAEHSNLILILRRPLTLPSGRTLPQMPSDGSDFMTTEMIAVLADWINRGCPQFATL